MKKYDLEEFLYFLFRENDELMISSWWGGFWYTKEEIKHYFLNKKIFKDLEQEKKKLYYQSCMESSIAEKVEKKKIPWFIYLIKSLDHYKIWKTTNIENRYKKYLTENPNKIELIHYFKCNDYTEMEIFLHDKFKHKNHNREWFNLADEDILFIKSFKND